MKVEELVIPDDIHDFLLWRNWKTVITATTDYFERAFMKGTTSSQPAVGGLGRLHDPN